MENVFIEYDKIVLCVNNYYNKFRAKFNCIQCVGMSQIITWDEIIIDNIEIKPFDLSENPLYDKAKELYAVDAADDGGYDKPLVGEFLFVPVRFINGTGFSVICRDVDLGIDPEQV